MKSSDPRHALEEILHVMGQQHLLNQLSTEDQYLQLLRQIKKIDLTLLAQQQKEIEHTEKNVINSAAPPISSLDNAPIADRKEIASRFGCIVLAGGVGSRLRLNSPKGFFEISLIKKKPLFQLLSEKIAAATGQLGVDIPVAFMTSIPHRTEIETFFIRHNFFGLKPAQVSFFSQISWPMLDLEGNLFFEKGAWLATGPNGNGDLYKRFVGSGIYDKWKKRGIEHVRIMPIDNPLALPVDLPLFAHHMHHKNDVTIQGVAKLEKEKVGVIYQVEGKLAVLEYGEYENNKPNLAANTGLFLFSMPFILRASKLTLPLHKARKAVSATVQSWKFETFLFDAFSEAAKAELICYPRKSIFAPLKNFEGEDSISSVQKAILAYERGLFKELTGNEPPQDAKFELGSSFYYPTDEQKAAWKGKSFPKQSYIEKL